MSVFANLRDDALADYLATKLTDYEFEMLIRKRIQLSYEQATGRLSPNEFDTSRAICEFAYKWEDKCNWHVRVGAEYNDAVYGDGEVLQITFDNAVDHWKKQHRNKLSLLLPAPTKTGFE